MEGRGVTNYSVDKPSYGFSTATTEFDDALISRGIVTLEQAMIAKGASPQEARRLVELKDHLEDIQTEYNQQSKESGSGEEDNDNYDAQIIKEYRQMRIEEIKNESARSSKQGFGDVLYISRQDWAREVNEASEGGLWVLINLARNSSTLSKRHDDMCEAVEDAFRELATEFESIKFVSIPSTSAIKNWPAENLPTIFCYRYGELQHQIISPVAFGGPGVNKGRLEWRLAKLGVLETDLEEDPKPDHYVRSNRARRTRSSPYTSKISNQFGVSGCLGTMRGDESDNYDGVD